MIISNQFAKKWTEGSIFCYRRGCNCQGCFVKDLIESQECEMKRAVFTLVRKFGAPPEPEEGKYTKVQKRIIEVIKSGISTREEIAAALNINVVNFNEKIRHLYRIAEEDGCVFLNKRNMLDTYIEWVKENL